MIIFAIVLFIVLWLIFSKQSQYWITKSLQRSERVTFTRQLRKIYLYPLSRENCKMPDGTIYILIRLFLEYFHCLVDNWSLITNAPFKKEETKRPHNITQEKYMCQDFRYAGIFFKFFWVKIPNKEMLLVFGSIN